MPAPCPRGGRGFGLLTYASESICCGVTDRLVAVAERHDQLRHRLPRGRPHVAEGKDRCPPYNRRLILDGAANVRQHAFAAGPKLPIERAAA